MSMTYSLGGQKASRFFVADDVHPQSLALVRTRGSAIGLDIVVGDADSVDFSKGDFCGALVQYPSTFGALKDYTAFAKKAHAGKVRRTPLHLRAQPL
jgi:glycine dehydrogenase